MGGLLIFFFFPNGFMQHVVQVLLEKSIQLWKYLSI